MNEADRKILALVEWLKTANDKPSIGVWKELQSVAPVDQKALTRQERNQRYYQAHRKVNGEPSVLNGLKNRLKPSYSSESVLNGKGFEVEQQTPEAEAWKAARGGRSLPFGKSGKYLMPTRWPPGHKGNAQIPLSDNQSRLSTNGSGIGRPE
jgi:hypothetical protein